MSELEIRTETTHSTARMPFRIAAGVLELLGPAGLIPVVAALVEGGTTEEIVGLAAGGIAVVVCTVMFARTAITGWTPMYTDTLTGLVEFTGND